MAEQKETGFVKKKVTLLIKTTIGDHWQNTDFCDFIEAKNGYIIVEEKEKL